MALNERPVDPPKQNVGWWEGFGELPILIRILVIFGGVAALGAVVLVARFLLFVLTHSASS